MNHELLVLRAMLRLARKRQIADLDALTARAGGGASAVRLALRCLEAQALVERLPSDRARLTLAGLAVAVSTIAIRAAAPKRATIKRRVNRAA